SRRSTGACISPGTSPSSAKKRRSRCSSQSGLRGGTNRPGAGVTEVVGWTPRTRTSAMSLDLSLAWLIAGFILIIAELMTWTFYLLVLGVAALVGAGVGYASGALVWQAIGAAIVAVAG